MIEAGVCNIYKTDLLKGVHQIDHEYKLALFSSEATLNKDTESYTGLSYECNSMTGYVDGGIVLTGISIFLDNDYSILDFNDPIWPNSSITARGGLIYNNSLSGKNAICILDFGLDYNSNNGDFKITFPEPTFETALIKIY